MQKRWINIILFLLFVSEGTLFQFLTPDYYGSNITITPRLVLVAIIYVSIFLDRHYALWLGVVFGLFYDIEFGRVLGVYTIAMGSIGYFSGWLTLFFHSTTSFFSLVELVGLTIFEFFVLGMMYLFQLVTVPIDYAAIFIIIPSILFNLVFAFIIYIPLQFSLENR